MVVQTIEKFHPDHLYIPAAIVFILFAIFFADPQTVIRWWLAVVTCIFLTLVGLLILSYTVLWIRDIKKLYDKMTGKKRYIKRKVIRY